MLIKLALGALGLVVVWVGYQHLSPAKRTDSYNTVIYVPGSYTPAWATKPWAWFLGFTFHDDVEVVVIDTYYTYENTPKARQGLEEARDRLVVALEQSRGANIQVVTHSYGAVLLHTVLQDRSELSDRVSQVVTMAGPLADDDSFADQVFLDSRDHLGYDASYRLPRHTAICGRFDTVVPCALAAYPGQETESLWSNHMAFALPQLVSGHRILRILQ